MPSYRIEYHRVWVRTVEAKNRNEARQIMEEEVSEDPDAEDYNYLVVKKPTDLTGQDEQREIR